MSKRIREHYIIYLNFTTKLNKNFITVKMWMSMSNRSVIIMYIKYHLQLRKYNNNNYARILNLFMLMIIPTSLWNTLTEFFESILL